jgi:methylmalonyl-CoA mutase cobalamin-binding subunit
MNKKILCVPLDPVHDVGIKIIKGELDKYGYETELLSPDLTMEAIAKKASQKDYDFILVSRTLGYGVAELLARFIDMMDASGVREKSKIILGGKPVTPELAAELGFDKGFGEHSSVEDVIAYIEGKEIIRNNGGLVRNKKDITEKYSYKFINKKIENLLNEISEKTLKWAEGKTSNGIERALLKKEIIYEENELSKKKLLEKYFSLSDETISAASEKSLYPKNVRKLSSKELNGLTRFCEENIPFLPKQIQHNKKHPAIFKFLGSGCPLMDITHAKICERYGIDGFLIINPSWEARYEGLLDGLLTHENDGTITSYENLKLIRQFLHEGTLLTVRSHRGLNTPETVLLAGEAGADLAKINLVYGSLGAGTDPERLAVDGLEAMKLSSKYNMPFDIPGNDELSGVPAWKTLGGLLINISLGLKLGAKPIPKPLFCHGPHIVLNGLMKDNFIDYNSAKIYALREIINCPIWPGEPIAFMTQTEERVQSSNSTSFHAALAASLGVDAITIASTDEAYSRGPITIASRIDSINSVTDAYRFLGDASFTKSPQSQLYTEELIDKIIKVLEEVNENENLPKAIYNGALGNKEDGAYPGTFGAGTVRLK